MASGAGGNGATTPQANLPKYFGLIDALRGVAALIVVISHYHHFYLANHSERASIPPTETYPYARFLSLLYDNGGMAVQLFWVISGFVFAHVYLNRPTTVRTFTLARIARLYPLHLATLLFVIVLQYISLNWAGHWQIYGNNDLRHFILQIFFASNWNSLSSGLSFNGPIWSVSLETVVYGIFLVTLPLLLRFGLTAAIALCVGMLVLYDAPDWGLPFLKPGVFACASYFFFGCCGYYLVAHQRTWVGFGALGAALLALGVGLWLGQETLMIATSAIGLVLILALYEKLCRPNVGGLLRRLGDMSYSLYLIHVPLQMTLLLICDLAFDGTREFADSMLTLPLYLVITVMVADLVYRRFERPSGAWIRSKLA